MHDPPTRHARSRVDGDCVCDLSAPRGAEADAHGGMARVVSDLVDCFYYYCEDFQGHIPQAVDDRNSLRMQR